MLGVPVEGVPGVLRKTAPPLRIQKHDTAAVSGGSGPKDFGKPRPAVQLVYLAQPQSDRSPAPLHIELIVPNITQLSGLYRNKYLRNLPQLHLTGAFSARGSSPLIEQEM